MASFLIAACVSVLLMCGAIISQATAASPASSLVQAFSILGGSFSNEAQVNDEKGRSDKNVNDFIVFKYQPMDIPAFNQYFPLLFDQRDNDTLLRASIVLSEPGRDGEYYSTFYNFTNVAQYKSGNLNLAELTMNDLAEQPLCKGVITRVGDVVMHMAQCATDDEGDSVTYALNHRCESSVVVFGKGSIEKYFGTPYVFSKTQQYSIPSSWLEGVDDYVNPCHA